MTKNDLIQQGVEDLKDYYKDVNTSNILTDKILKSIFKKNLMLDMTSVEDKKQMKVYESLISSL